MTYFSIEKSSVREVFIHEQQKGMQEPISIILRLFAHTAAVENP